MTETTSTHSETRTCADLRARRLAVGLTQERLAVMAGTSAATVRRIEAGQIAPRETTLRAIAAALARASEMVPPASVPVPRWRACPEPLDDGGEPLGYHVPPECQGQIMERAYAMHDGMMYRRSTDRSDRSVRYEARELLDADPDPWNREPR